MSMINDGEQYFNHVFEELNFADQQCKNTEFEDCQFVACDFSGVSFHNCNFYNCDFSRCNLSLTDFSGSKLFAMTFQDSKLTGIDWTKANWPVYHLDFELTFQRCLMNDSSFFGLQLNELIIEECQLQRADFREGSFDKSLLTGCDFGHSLFSNTSLNKTDFSDSTNYSINVLENQVKGAKFSRFEAVYLLEHLGIELVD